MSNDFENSQECRKAFEIAKKQQELYKNLTKAISPEALAKFQELSDKLNVWKNSLNSMPGLLKFAEMLKNYQREVRETEGLTEGEFEEKYRTEIEWSEKFGKNGWVISEHSNPADIKNWEQLLCEGEAKVAEFFDGEDIVILDVIIEGLQEKYVSDETQLYFKNGMQALQIKRRRTLDSIPKNEDSYDNYWRCFFEMISTCFEILVGIKKTVDDILYQQYSV